MAEQNASLKQKQLLLQKITSEYKEFWGIDDRGFFTPSFLTHVRGLFFKAYWLYLDGESLSLMRAKEWIPGSHNDTRTKYLQRAIEEGYFELVPSLEDKRRTLLKVTPKLIVFAEERLEHELKKMDEIISAKE